MSKTTHEVAGAALLALCQSPKHDGPQWAHESEDLDMTLLCWKAGKRLGPMVNSEVDNLLIGMEGEGRVTVDGVAHALTAGVAVMVPKSCERSIESVSENFCYLSVHKRRRGLMPS